MYACYYILIAIRGNCDVYMTRACIKVDAALEFTFTVSREIVTKSLINREEIMQT